jgi:hypothetical protein
MRLSFSLAEVCAILVRCGLWSVWSDLSFADFAEAQPLMISEVKLLLENKKTTDADRNLPELVLLFVQQVSSAILTNFFFNWRT